MSLLAFDVETHPFSPGNMRPPLVCASLAWLDQGGVHSDLLRFKDPGFNPAMDTYWAGADPLVGHYIAYDMSCLGASLPGLMAEIFRKYDQGEIVCTKVRERLLDIALGENPKQRGWYSLEGLSRRIMGEDRSADKADPDSWRTRYRELENIAVDRWPAAARDYALKDAESLIPIWQNQQARAQVLRYQSFGMEARRQSSYDFALSLTGAYGMTPDQGAVQALLKKLEAGVAQAEVVAKKGGVLRSDGTRDMKATRNLVQATWSGPGEVPSTPKGAIKTDRETLEGCDSEVLEQYARFVHLKKMISTYIEALNAPIVHPFFNVLGAVSGRTSCRSPNIQNQPREGNLRECFRPRPGFRYVSVDYSTQELRTLAQTQLDLFGISPLALEYQKDPGFDAHQDLANTIGCTRQEAKAANFGFPGGLGAETFLKYAKGTYGVEMELEQAKNLKEAFMDRWDMQRFFDYVEGHTKNDNGTLVLPRSGRMRGGCRYTSFANGLFQGPASDASKTALFDVARECYAEPDSPLYDSRPVAFIHDEILIEAPEGKAEEAMERMKEVMEHAHDKWTPDVPSVAAGKVMDRWEK